MTSLFTEIYEKPMFDLYHSIFIISYAESFVNNVLVIIHKFLSRVKLFEVNCYNTFDKSYKNGLHLSQKPKRAILQQDIITYKVGYVNNTRRRLRRLKTPFSTLLPPHTAGRAQNSSILKLHIAHKAPWKEKFPAQYGIFSNNFEFYYIFCVNFVTLRIRYIFIYKTTRK